ncbi:MAG: WD40 repeat domain-containing protein [Gemmataceae bacterium]
MTRVTLVVLAALAVGCPGRPPTATVPTRPTARGGAATLPTARDPGPAVDQPPGHPGPLLTADAIPAVKLHRVPAGTRVSRYSYPESYRPLHHGPTPAPEPIPVLPTRTPTQVLGDLRFLAPGSDRGCVALSPDGRRLALGSCVFDAATGALDAAYDVGGSSVHKLAFSPDGALLYASEGPGSNVPTHGGMLAVRDAASKEQVLTLSAADWGLSGDGRLLATLESVPYDPYEGKPGPRPALAHFYPAVRIYDTKTWVGVAAYRVNAPSPTAVALSPDGSRIVLGCHDGAVRVWDRGANKEVLTLRDLCETPYPTHKPVVHLITFSPDGKTLAAANARPHDSNTPREVAWWRWPDGKRAHRRPHGPYYDPTDLRFSPDNRFLYVGIGGGGKVWDAATGEVRAELLRDTHKRVVPYLAFAASDRACVADGGRPKQVAFPSLDPLPWPDPPFRATPPEPGFATVAPMPPTAPPPQTHPGFDLPDGGRVRVLRPFDEREAGFEHTGRDGKRVRHYEAGRTGGYAVSPDGRVLVTCASASGISYGAYDYAKWESPIRFWELATGRELGAVRVYPRATGSGFVFSPDGTRLAVPHSDGLVRLWDVATRKPLLALDPNGYWLWQLSFSADGRFLVAGDYRAATLIVWDATDPPK